MAAWMEGEFWERMDTCICMAEFLPIHLKLSQHCLFISYTSVQNKKFFFKATNQNIY